MFPKRGGAAVVKKQGMSDCQGMEERKQEEQSLILIVFALFHCPEKKKHVSPKELNVKLSCFLARVKLKASAQSLFSKHLKHLCFLTKVSNGNVKLTLD